MPKHLYLTKPYEITNDNKQTLALVEIDITQKVLGIFSKADIVEPSSLKSTNINLNNYVKVPSSFGVAGILTAEKHSELWQTYLNSQNKRPSLTIQEFPTADIDEKIGIVKL